MSLNFELEQQRQIPSSSFVLNSEESAVPPSSSHHLDNFVEENTNDESTITVSENNSFECNLLREICLIIDFDGYIFDKIFKPREIGYCSLTSDENDSILVDLRASVKTMTKEDKKCNTYIKSFICGLTLTPVDTEENCIDENETENVIMKLYNDHKTVTKSIVAYKGGIHEKNLLDKLEIPNLNLEDYECPKFEKLLSMFRDEIEKSGKKTCGRHIQLKDRNKVVHCSRMETYVFAKWVRYQISMLEQKK